MAIVPEYVQKRRGVTTEEVPEGEHEAVIGHIETVTKTREQRKYDEKAKARIVQYNEYGDPIMEDYTLLEVPYKITDMDGGYVVTSLLGMSMNPGDAKDDFRMRSNLYKDCMLLNELPSKGGAVDTDRFEGRKVLVKVIGKRGKNKDIEWANVEEPIRKVLDGGKQDTFDDDANDPRLV